MADSILLRQVGRFLQWFKANANAITATGSAVLAIITLLMYFSAPPSVLVHVTVIVLLCAWVAVAFLGYAESRRLRAENERLNKALHLPPEPELNEIQCAILVVLLRSAPTELSPQRLRSIIVDRFLDYDLTTGEIISELDELQDGKLVRARDTLNDPVYTLTKLGRALAADAAKAARNTAGGPNSEMAQHDKSFPEE